METIAIVFGVIWFVSGCYIGYTVNHYYDKLWYSPICYCEILENVQKRKG